MVSPEDRRNEASFGHAQFHAGMGTPLGFQGVLSYRVSLSSLLV